MSNDRDPQFSEEFDMVENEGLSPDYLALLREKYRGTSVWQEFAEEHGIEE